MAARLDLCWTAQCPCAVLEAHSMKIRYIVIGSLMLGVAASANAAYKCKRPDGSVAFQDLPCPSETTAERIRLPPPNTIGAAADRPEHIRAAIAGRRPEVGMTIAELERAIGAPDKVNAAQYGREFKDQLIYYTETRTIYVYTTNGIVTAVQNTEGGRPTQRVSREQYSPPRKDCPSEGAISDLEFEIRKTSNRGQPRVLAELYRQLGEARACLREAM